MYFFDWYIQNFGYFTYSCPHDLLMTTQNTEFTLQGCMDHWALYSMQNCLGYLTATIVKKRNLKALKENISTSKYQISQQRYYREH